MSNSWGGDDDVRSVEKAMNRHRIICALKAPIERERYCRNCEEKARVAEEYRRQRDHLQEVCAKYEERLERRDPVTHVIAVFIAICAAGIVARVLTSPSVLRLFGGVK